MILKEYTTKVKSFSLVQTTELIPTYTLEHIQKTSYILSPRKIFSVENVGEAASTLFYILKIIGCIFIMHKDRVSASYATHLRAQAYV